MLLLPSRKELLVTTNTKGRRQVPFFEGDISGCKFSTTTINSKKKVSDLITQLFELLTGCVCPCRSLLTIRHKYVEPGSVDGWRWFVVRQAVGGPRPYILESPTAGIAYVPHHPTHHSTLPFYFFLLFFFLIILTLTFFVIFFWWTVKDGRQSES